MKLPTDFVFVVRVSVRFQRAFVSQHESHTASGSDGAYGILSKGHSIPLLIGLHRTGTAIKRGGHGLPPHPCKETAGRPSHEAGLQGNSPSCRESSWRA